MSCSRRNREKALFGKSGGTWACIPRTCSTQGMPDRGKAPAADHVHMLISIPPKYSVAEVIGYLKGKSSIWIAQNVEAECSGLKILGEGLLRLDRRTE